MPTALLRNHRAAFGAAGLGVMQKEFDSLNLALAGDLPAWPFVSPYLAILLAVPNVTEERRREVCEWLIETGCLYLVVRDVAYGALDWIASINEANKKAFQYGEIPESKRVQTVCIDFVAILELVRFAEQKAAHPTEGKLPHVLISLT